MQKSSLNTSGFKGVYFYKRDKKWYARIKVRGAYIWLGSFDNKIDAAKRYDEAAKSLHGEFAVLNEYKEVKNGVQ